MRTAVEQGILTILKEIRAEVAALQADVTAIKATQDNHTISLAEIGADVDELIVDIEGPPVPPPPPIVGIVPVLNSLKGKWFMATKAKLVKVFKKGTAKAAVGAPPVAGSFGILDSGNGVTVNGLDAAGNMVPLPSTFSLTVTSDAPGNVSVGAVTGTSALLNNPVPVPPPAVGSTANVTVTATDSATPLTAGSPFVFTMACTVLAGNIVGIDPVVTP